MELTDSAPGGATTRPKDGGERRRSSRSRSRGSRRSRSRSASHEKRRRRSSSRERRDRDNYGRRDSYRTSSSRPRDDDRRSRDRDRDREYSRSRSRYYEDRDRDRRSNSRRRSGSRSPSRQKATSVMELLNKVMGGGIASSVASAILPSGAGLPSFGVPTTMTDVTGTLAKIQALSGNMPNGAEKSMRELYVGGLPMGVALNANQIRDFFNLVMTQSGLVRGPGQPVVQARIHESGGFAFVQFRSQEETDLALSLNGIPFMNSPLKIGRPKGYQQAMATVSQAQSGTAAVSAGQLASMAGALGLSAAPTTNEVSDEVILVANIPTMIDISALKEIMSPFGPLSDCVVIPPAAGAATQKALVRYETANLADIVISGLNNMPIGDATLALSKAPIPLVLQHLPHRAASYFPIPAPQAPVAASTDIVELENIIVWGDINSDEDLLDIKEDVAEECAKYGRVVEVVVPSIDWRNKTPGDSDTSVPVYVHFGSIADAEKCAEAMRSKKFEGRLVVVSFVDAERLHRARLGGASDGANGIGADVEDEEDAGFEGGHGQHFGSVAVPPPFSYESQSAVMVGGPEDGLNLPPVPAAADLD